MIIDIKIFKNYMRPSYGKFTSRENKLSLIKIQ